MEILGWIHVPWWGLTVVVTVFTICVYTWYKQSLFSRLGLKQKKPVFFLGDIPDVTKKGLGYLGPEMCKEYGPVFGTYFGNRPTLVICDADIIKQITVKQFDKFTNRASLPNMRKIWKSALITSEDDDWRRIRPIISPTFTSGKMKNMGPHIQKCLDIFHGIIEKQIEEHPTGFDLDSIVRAYTLDVIFKTGFGIDASVQTEPESEFIKQAKKMSEFGGTNMAILLSLFFPDVIRLFPKLFAADMVDTNAINFFMTTANNILQERRQTTNAQGQKDLFQLMVDANMETDKDSKKLSDEEVLINSVIFIMAAYDTTATTILWMIYELAIHPDIQDKLINAIDNEIADDKLTYDNVFTMTYLNMVMSEVLRIDSPVTRVNRVASEDVEINGIKIPKGMDCTYVPDIMHFLDEYWDDPNAFNPERFSPENKSKINDYAYLAFGVGPRNCVGMRLAQLEVKMTIASMLQKYRFHRTDQLKVPMPIDMKSQTVRKPGDAVFVRVEKRK